MTKLVSSWADGETLPESYVFPPGKRPGELVVPASKSVPVIDLSMADGFDRKIIIEQIIEASQEFGFFQVINHGVRRALMNDARTIFNSFFQQPPAELASFCNLDVNQKCIVYTSIVEYDNEQVHDWRDSLRLMCSPLAECIDSWPRKPARFREVVAEYTSEVKGLGSRILELISEGLGLEPEYCAGKLSQNQILTIHHYPPCPDPSLTSGNRKHCDPDLITILLQGDVPGLQVLKDGEWIGVQAIPGAFVVNIGLQLQILSNGKLVSVEHRAVTNKHEARTTAAFFIQPTNDCLVEPARAIANKENPPIYRSVLYEEFRKTFSAAYEGNTDTGLEHYKI